MCEHTADIPQAIPDMNAFGEEALITCELSVITGQPHHAEEKLVVASILFNTLDVIGMLSDSFVKSCLLSFESFQ